MVFNKKQVDQWSVEYLRTLSLDDLGELARQLERDKTVAVFRRGKVAYVAHSILKVERLFGKWIKEQSLGRTTTYDDKKLYESAIKKYGDEEAAEANLHALKIKPTEAKEKMGVKKKPRAVTVEAVAKKHGVDVAKLGMGNPIKRLTQLHDELLRLQTVDWWDNAASAIRLTTQIGEVALDLADRIRSALPEFEPDTIEVPHA